DAWYHALVPASDRLVEDAAMRSFVVFALLLVPPASFAAPAPLSRAKQDAAEVVFEAGAAERGRPAPSPPRSLLLEQLPPVDPDVSERLTVRVLLLRLQERSLLAERIANVSIDGTLVRLRGRAGALPLLRVLARQLSDPFSDLPDEQKDRQAQ